MMHQRVFALALLVAGAAFVAEASPVRRITLDLKDADLHNVMRLLSDVGKVNLVIPDDVKGKVTIKLRNVPWTEALDVILRSKGLGQEHVGNVIQIDTLERILAREKMRAELLQAREDSGELRTIIIPLSYADAASVKTLIEPLLTKRGKAQVDTRTNTLIVTDIAPATERVRSVTESR